MNLTQLNNEGGLKKLGNSKLKTEYSADSFPQLILVTISEIFDFFSFMDSISDALCCDTVYIFSCPRVCAHEGLSDRLVKPLPPLKQSAIRDLVMTCGSDIPIEVIRNIAFSGK